MARSRLLSVVCLLLGALALSLPAAALAGGSAGNQQYTDPFSSTTTHAAPAPAATAPATTTTAAPAATQTAAPVPTATVATAPGVTTDASSGGTLPYSGYADWMAAGFGATLLGAGALLRRRTREER